MLPRSYISFGSVALSDHPIDTWRLGGRQELAATAGEEVETAALCSPDSLWRWVYQMVASGSFYHFRKEASVRCRLPRLPLGFSKLEQVLCFNWAGVCISHIWINSALRMSSGVILGQSHGLWLHVKLQLSAPLYLIQSKVFTLLINTVNDHLKVQSLILLVNHWMIGVASGVMLTCILQHV